MRLIHVTAKHNLDSIKANGLDPKFATMKRRAVWGVSPSNEAWAVAHTLGKPRAAGLSIHDHVTIEVDVPRSWLRRHKRGIWYCLKTITEDRFIEVRESSRIGEEYPH